MVQYNTLHRDKGVHSFPKGISPKVNTIAWLEFEHGYYDVAAQNVSQYQKVSTH